MPQVRRRGRAPTTSAQAELDDWGALANHWWDPEGPQKALHALNPARLGYVASANLRDAQVLNIGSGGGLLGEKALAAASRSPAVKVAAELIKVAELVRLETGVVDYRLQWARRRALAEEMPGRFDAITCMEMLEHVPDPAAVVRACARLLKPGGRLFLLDLNPPPRRLRWPSSAPSTWRGCCRAPVAELVFQSIDWPPGCARPRLRIEDVSGLIYEHGATRRG